MLSAPVPPLGSFFCFKICPSRGRPSSAMRREVVRPGGWGDGLAGMSWYAEMHRRSDLFEGCPRLALSP